MEESLIGRDEKIERRERRWVSVLIEEAKRLGYLAGPMMAVTITQFLFQVISTMMVGHLGVLALSSSSIAVSLSGVTGFSVLLGMASALETLCGQAYGAQQYRKLGIHTHTAIFCLILVCIPLSILWSNMGKLLVLIGQDPLISQEAGKFITWLIPALFAYAVFQPLVRYFQTQSLITPMLWCSCASLLIHIPLCWVLVFKSGLENVGGALAVSISNWLNVIFLALYMTFSHTCAKTRVPVSMELFKGINEFFRFAIPSAVMICLEWWSYELMVLLSGLLPNPELETSVLSICNDKEVVDYVTTMAPLVCISVILDSLQGVLSGVARGCGWQHIGAYVNLGAFYLCGIPVAATLAFWFQLRGMGLWIGIQSVKKEDILFIKYHIHITNDLPSDLPPGVPYLQLHCKSKTKDLGLRKMLRHEDYKWDTRINYWRTTLFFCNVSWEGKQRYIEAFKAIRDEWRCLKYHHSCMWSVREDGIYFSNNNSTWRNAYPWPVLAPARFALMISSLLASEVERPFAMSNQDRGPREWFHFNKEALWVNLIHWLGKGILRRKSGLSGLVVVAQHGCGKKEHFASSSSPRGPPAGYVPLELRSFLSEPWMLTNNFGVLSGEDKGLMDIPEGFGRNYRAGMSDFYPGVASKESLSFINPLAIAREHNNLNGLLCIRSIRMKNEEDLLFINYHIHITNDLPTYVPPKIPFLDLHCKSKTRDLGEKKLVAASIGTSWLSRPPETKIVAGIIITLACGRSGGMGFILAKIILLGNYHIHGLLQRKVHVQISNDIGQGTDLTVHCKSKDSDLGNQVISYQGTWEFHFRPNFWCTTQYYCSMAWKNKFQWFDIFVYDRDYMHCHVCKWSIKPDGPCRFNYDTSKFDTCFKWNDP
ncbi:Multi antimicrobial extrusion protein [Corchorus olitorius]|uniref:Protein DETOXIFICATION n=1 Tax=Corchorus olitorius TaxID=93759 RepID=A0A1R3GNV7_9ROSI|nr:Multi antimicrobial extrusion protein [Corchorus olitorius]